MSIFLTVKNGFVNYEYTQAAFEDYKRQGMFYYKEQEKAYKIFIKWNNNKNLLKNFLKQVFGNEAQLKEAVFFKKADDLFFEKYKAPLNTSDFLDIILRSLLVTQSREAPPFMINRHF